MPIDEQGRWQPDLFDRQFEVFNSHARALLVCGPRLSGKTWSVLHRIIRHLWETPGARIACFAKTLKNAKDGGVWDDLLKIALPEWLDAGIGMEFTTKGADKKPGPKTDGQTRTPYFRVRNAHGGESELKLFSLDVDDEVEAKIKSQRFSMIYFSELSAFKDRKVLTIALPQLRMPHLRKDQQMWISDTNPGEEGDSSWIYQLFYKERLMTYDEYVKSRNGLPVMAPEVHAEFYGNLALIEIKPEENPHLDPDVLNELKAMYAYDDGLYARYVEGKWVYGDGDASRHFAGAFNRAVHVVGDCTSFNEDDWTYLLPSSNCYEIISGWDPGETFHAAVLIEKIVTQGCLSMFHILDEYVSLKKDLSIETLTEEVVERLKWFEADAGHPLLTTRCWSDNSAIIKYSALADSYVNLEVFKYSEGRFFMQAVPKAKHSIRLRVRLLKKLLVQKRIRVSAHCVNVIAMLERLKRGKVDFVVENEDKHVFDAMTYALFMECHEELVDGEQVNVGRKSLDVGVPLG